MYQYSKRQLDNQTSKKFIIAGLIGLLPFLYFAIIGFSDWTNVTAQDYEIGGFFYNLRMPMRTTIATAITRLADRGGQTIITVATVLVLFLSKKMAHGFMVWFDGINWRRPFEWLCQNIYQRIRPDQIEHLVDQGGYSFPSGHAMGSMIICGGLIFLIFRYFKSNWVNGVSVSSLEF